MPGAVDPLEHLGPNPPSDHALCRDPSQTLTIGTIALLSARFPLVSPTGGIFLCDSAAANAGLGSEQGVSTERRRQAYRKLYLVDGGYYESSGVLTLLDILEAIQPRLIDFNLTDTGHLNPVEVWLVVLRNSFRSVAASAEVVRPLELLAPFQSLANNRIGTPEYFIERGRALLGDPPERCSQAPTIRPSLAPGALGSQTPTGRRLVRGCLLELSPLRRPSVGAPLGWVLSNESRNELNAQMSALVGQPSGELARLCRLLHGSSAVHPCRPNALSLR